MSPDRTEAFYVPELEIGVSLYREFVEVLADAHSPWTPHFGEAVVRHFDAARSRCEVAV